MAIAVPLQTRLDQYWVETDALIERGKQFKRELIAQAKKGMHLMVEVSPLCTRIFLLGQIPQRVVDLIVNLAKTFFCAVISLSCCGLHSGANKDFKLHGTKVMEFPFEVAYLFYAAINPQSGIDKYYDFLQQCVR